MDKIVRQTLSKAIRFLRYRPRTRMEVYRRLKREELPEEVINEVMKELEKEGHFDDFAFSLLWIEERIRTRGLSPSAIWQELRQKGVTEKTIEQVFEDFKFNEQEVVFQLLNKKSHIIKDQEKLVSFLRRRGYPYEKAKNYVKQWLEKENE